MKNNKEPFSLLHIAFPIIITGIYLISGFVFKIWHPSWIVFLTIPIYYIIYDEIEKGKKRTARWLDYNSPKIDFESVSGNLIINKE